MNKKYIVSFIAIALVVVSGASILALRQNGDKPLTTVPRAETSDSTRVVQTQSGNQPKNTALKEYSDPSGFRILYPSDLNIVVEQSDDQDIYASLKLKTNQTSEYISIKATGTNFAKLDDWLKANKISPASATIKRMVLGDIDAYQVPIQNQLVTAAFDQGVLFTILLTAPKNDTLHAAYDKIINSFTFYQPEGAAVEQSTPQSDTTSDVSSDIEEIIE